MAKRRKEKRKAVKRASRGVDFPVKLTEAEERRFDRAMKAVGLKPPTVKRRKER